jgi:arginine deiminase
VVSTCGRRASHCFLGRAEALSLAALRIVETGGNAWQAEREQWDDGNNVVALEPGIVVAYDRNFTPTRCCARPGSK